MDSSDSAPRSLAMSGLEGKSAWMKLCFHHSKNKSLDVVVEDRTLTIALLKNKIAKDVGIEACQQIFYLRKKPLLDHKTLEDYGNLSSGATIHIVRGLMGGGEEIKCCGNIFSLRICSLTLYNATFPQMERDSVGPPLLCCMPVLCML